jgi:hypothetical protein
MEERAKQTKMERVMEINVYKWFEKVKRMPGNGLSRRILKWRKNGKRKEEKN